MIIIQSPCHTTMNFVIQVIFMALMFTFLWKNDIDATEYESSLGKMDENQIKKLSVTRHEGHGMCILFTLITCYIEKSKSLYWVFYINVYNYYLIVGDVDIVNLNAEASGAGTKKGLDSKMRAMMKEVVFYVSFIVLLLIVVNGNQDENVFWQNQNLRDSYVHVSGLEDVGVTFHCISPYKGMFDLMYLNYIRITFVYRYVFLMTYGVGLNPQLYQSFITHFTTTENQPKIMIPNS